MAGKVMKMKLWPDESGAANWKQSVTDISGEVLCVSQFTLLASTKKGNKPDFHGAAAGEQAKTLYDLFVSKIKNSYQPDKVKDGVFQAMMDVGLVNDGPVTLELEVSPPKESIPRPTKAGISQSSGSGPPPSES